MKRILNRKLYQEGGRSSDDGNDKEFESGQGGLKFIL